MSAAPADDDEALLRASRAGDRAALEQLLARYQPRIYRFALRMCRDPEAASDVLQETLIAAARTLRDYRGAASLSTWLYTIARSFCIKTHRRSKFAPAREESLDDEAVSRDLAAPAPSPEAQSADAEVTRALSAAIAELEPMYREVLLLRDGEGMSASEVAQIVGASVDAVKSRLHRARAAVRAAVTTRLGIVEGPPAPSCPDVIELFSKHREDEISPTVCAEMEQHLAGCEACRARCDSLQDVLDRCRSLDAPAPS